MGNFLKKGGIMIRAIQFGPKRSGSTFLQEAINSHSEIIGIDEIFVNNIHIEGAKKSGFIPYCKSDEFNEDDPNPSKYIRKIHNTYPDKNTIFKLMYNQINFHRGLLYHIVKNKIPIIHLTRKNLIKQFISGINAAMTTHDPIDIKPHELLNEVKNMRYLNESWSERLQDNIKLKFTYEDIIGEKKGEKTYVSDEYNDAICDFFGVEKKRLFAKTKKKNKEDIRVYLPNFDEIKEIFKETEFEWMLY